MSSLLTLILTAVIIVGPIDGDTGPQTLNEIVNAERAAVILEANGITVHRFYTPDNDWEEIKAASSGAHFFIYRGLGNYSYPLSLKEYDVPHTQVADLRFWPGSIAMFYSDYSAGSSSDDTSQISGQEAYSRVIAYSQPFLDAGVGIYYAAHHYNSFDWHVSLLLDGMTAGETYETSPYYNAETTEAFTHPTRSDYVVWLGKQWVNTMWEYNNAFVGNPNSLAQWEVYKTFVPLITK